MNRFLLLFIVPLLIAGCGKNGADDPALTISNSDVSLPAGEGSRPVIITTTVPWTADISPATASSWVAILPTSSQAGTTTALVQSVDTNLGETRYASITVRAGDLVRTINVSQEAPTLTVDPASINFVATGGIKSLTVTTNLPSWDFTKDGLEDWCTATKVDNKLQLEAKPSQGEYNIGSVTITAETLSRTVEITQNFYTDKQVVKLQSHSVGTGVNLIIMGDGYTSASMGAKGGRYERDMTDAMNHFFSTYPLNAFRNYFDVYMVAAVSAEAGMSSKTPALTVNTRFKTLWEGAGSTGIDCDEEAVFEYVRAIDEFSDYTINQLPMHDLTVLMPINRDVYAGTCIMWFAGFSISMIPVSTRIAESSFKNILVHESCGHGFAKLADEYYRGTDTEYSYYPNDEKIEVQGYKQEFGVYANVDFSSDVNQTSWAGFVNTTEKQQKYNVVRTFEGADSYGRGIWRPENNSCMNNNVLYFNAPSRYAQVKRVMELSGQDTNYTVDEFISWEVVVPVPLNAPVYRSSEQFIPLAPPVIRGSL